MGSSLFLESSLFLDRNQATHFPDLSYSAVKANGLFGLNLSKKLDTITFEMVHGFRRTYSL